ncbi:hypothetical protein [Streptomyces sp. WAC04114]|nr:hypothetical protein [Streptomyces sp. WAC04114]
MAGHRTGTRPSFPYQPSLPEDGTLAKIEQRWLSDAVDAPVLK